MNIKITTVGVVLASALLLDSAWATGDASHIKQHELSHQHMQASEYKSIKEATKALEMTGLALKQLDEHKTDEALKTLALVTGQLEVIVAQYPNLALAPIDSQVAVLDYQGNKNTVEAIRKSAVDLLEDGHLQEARLLMKDIASEIVISTRKLPLATYPDVITSVVPMIQKGKLREAKMALEQALSTVVVTQNIIPLPVLRASTALSNAQKLANKDKRDAQANTSLKSLLHEAKRQLEWAEILGYGNKEAYQPLYQTIQDIEKKTSDGSHEQGLFDKLKEKIKALVA